MQESRSRRTGAASPLFATTFFSEVAGQSIHRCIVGAADERGGLPFLRHQPDLDHLLQMMGERRRRSAKPSLQLANRNAFLAYFHEDAVDLEPGRIAEGFKLCGCIIEGHRKKLF